MSKRKGRPLSIADMAQAGTAAIDMYGKRATADDANNPVITAMATAVVTAVMNTRVGNDEALALSIGYAVLAAYKYGQKSVLDPIAAPLLN